MSIPIQMLSSSKNTVKRKHKIMFEKISDDAMAQFICHIDTESEYGKILVFDTSINGVFKGSEQENYIFKCEQANSATS